MEGLQKFVVVRGERSAWSQLSQSWRGVRLLRGGVWLIRGVYSLLEGSVDYWLWGGYSLWRGVHVLSLVDY